MNQAKQAVNPYLPSYEYVPDGEPHVFNGRVYVYGSHDRFGGNDFCLNDYVCWSARADDLANWRYEGTSYRSVQDPLCDIGHWPRLTAEKDSNIPVQSTRPIVSREML